MKKLKLLIILILFHVESNSAEDLKSFSIKQSNAIIISEGTRISADLYVPKTDTSIQKLPVIIMANGWGGTANQLKDTAQDFARTGFYVIVFDYRGWGKSDGKLISTKLFSGVKKDLKYSTEVREIREIVDILDQADDYFSVINWIYNDPAIDNSKIGLWGTSMSGGLVVYVASRDKRVKAIVSQVGGMGWGIYSKNSYNEWYSLANKRAKGIYEYPPAGIKENGVMNGALLNERLLRFNPIEDSVNLQHCSSLFIVAQNEDLMKNGDHSFAAYERATGNKKYIEIPKIKHYDIYTSPNREIAVKHAIEWFNQNLN